MNKTVLVGSIIFVLGMGGALAQDFMPPFAPGMSSCAPIETAMGLLDLSKEQNEQIGGLSQSYGKDYEAEMAKLREALDAKYADEVKKLLNDQQKGQFDALMAADTKSREATQKADDDYRAKLIALIYEGVEDTALIQRELRYLPRDENMLLDRFMNAQKDLLPKYQMLKEEKGKAIADIYQKNKLEQGATRDLKAIQEWRDTTTRLTKEADQKFTEQSIGLLNDEQNKTLEAAKEAQKQWTEATTAADETYKQEIEAVVGPEKAAHIQMFQRSRMFRHRF